MAQDEAITSGTKSDSSFNAFARKVQVKSKTIESQPGRGYEDTAFFKDHNKYIHAAKSPSTSSDSKLERQRILLRSHILSKDDSTA